MGPADAPVVPPVLAADIAGGSYPAVVNILLGLIGREKTGKGTHLDIAMTENMFMLETWALGDGFAASKWPKSGAELLTGGSPRYQVYRTSDGRYVAAAPLEQRFWENFCELIGLPEALRDDHKDPAASIAKVREIIAGKDAVHWWRTFHTRDCCCTIVMTLEEAVQEPHFAQRGVFAHKLENEFGAEIPAAPVSVARQFRADPEKPKKAPALGGHNDAVMK